MYLPVHRVWVLVVVVLLVVVVVVMEESYPERRTRVVLYPLGNMVVSVAAARHLHLSSPHRVVVEVSKAAAWQLPSPHRVAAIRFFRVGKQQHLYLGFQNYR